MFRPKIRGERFVSFLSLGAGDTDNDNTNDAAVFLTAPASGKKRVISNMIVSVDAPNNRQIGCSIQFYSGTAAGAPSSLTPISTRRPIPGSTQAIYTEESPELIGQPGANIFAVLRLDVPAGADGVNLGLEGNFYDVDA